MKTYAVCSFLMLSSLSLEAGYYILPADKGPAILRQCSRPSTENVAGFFAPKPSQVVELEIKLNPYLHSTRPAIHLEQYNRQYVGFIKDGKRYIYGNFFKSDYKDRRAASEPVVVCDGGEWFWSIVYSLDSKTFQDIHFNGGFT